MSSAERSSLKVAIVGYGRMGRAIEAELVARGHAVIARLGRGETLAAAATAATAGCDLAFEFTRPAEAEGNVLRLLDLRVPTVCGTTGWDTAAAAARATELKTPLLVAANFSLGVAVLRRLTAEASRLLLKFPEYDAGVFEVHHTRKLDAPSGTAKMLARALQAQALQNAAAPERAGEVPVVALRLGEQPGEHHVVFEGPDESLELVHRARSRRLFAAGAVRAGEWLFARRPAGAVTLDTFLEETLR